MVFKGVSNSVVKHGTLLSADIKPRVNYKGKSPGRVGISWSRAVALGLCSPCPFSRCAAPIPTPLYFSFLSFIADDRKEVQGTSSPCAE